MFDDLQAKVKTTLEKIDAVLSASASLPVDIHTDLAELADVLQDADKAIAAITDLAIDADAILEAVPEHLKAMTRAGLSLAATAERTMFRISAAAQEATKAAAEATRILSNAQKAGLHLDFPTG